MLHAYHINIHDLEMKKYQVLIMGEILEYNQQGINIYPIFFWLGHSEKHNKSVA